MNIGSMVGILSRAKPAGMPIWLHEVLQSVLGSIYSALYGASKQTFDVMFITLNEKVVWASSELTKNPQSWNGSAFSLAEYIAENALIPIAACMVSFIFCWELIHLMQEGNHMQNIRPDTILLVLLKLALCMLACAKSFTIIMGFFEIGADATKSVIGKSTVETFGEGLKFEDVLPPVTENYAFSDVLDALIAMLLLFIAWILTLAVGAIIYIRINMWFIELLMYTSAAPIPFATFGNKEWGQMGMNYARKMLALSFEGFFMLLAFAMFGAVMSGIGGGNFYESVVMIIAAGFSLCMVLFKAGNISASIFNAH